MKKLLLSASILAISAAGAYAATQGVTGATSNGDLDITLTVNSQLKVSNLADIALGLYSGVDMTGTSPACVYFNTGAGYDITFDSTVSAGTFQLDDDSTGTIFIPYSVEYDDVGDGSNYQAVTAGTALTGQNNAESAANDDCVTRGSDNGTIRVTALSADITGSANDTYADTLTVLVEPGI